MRLAAASTGEPGVVSRMFGVRLAAASIAEPTTQPCSVSFRTAIVIAKNDGSRHGTGSLAY